MDFLKKHYFWIICGVLVVAALGAWVWTSMDMTARFAADQAKIDTAIADLTAVQNIQNHPNDITFQHMDERIKALKGSVKQAWLDQYTQQAQIFVWPDEIFDRPTRNALSKYRPIELHFPVFPTPDADEVNPTWRFAYSNYMRDELPKLAEIIGAKWQVNTDAPATTGSEGYGGAGYSPYSTPDISSSSVYPGAESGLPGAIEVERPVVDWNSANQQEIYNLRFNWAARPNSTPTTLEMLYAQEDFWTLQSLMEIIRRTNGDADAYYEALVKEIQFIRIGARAVYSDAMVTPMLAPGVGTGTLTGPEGMPVEGSSSGDPYAVDGMPMPGMEGVPQPGMPGVEGSGSGMPTLMAIDPATGRYVDNAYKPLTAEELRASLTTTDPTKAYLAVAKRMPVRMRLRMDQRYLSRLLIECANAPLTLEVRQVRINPSTSGAAASGYGGGMGSSYSMPSSMPSSGGFGSFSSSGTESYSSGSPYGESGTGGPGPGSSFDAVVEIYGIVYIYNPPATTALEAEAAEGSETTPEAPAGETLTSVE